MNNSIIMIKFLLFLLSFSVYSQSYTTMIYHNNIDQSNHLELSFQNPYLLIGFYNTKNYEGFISVYEVSYEGKLEFQNSSCQYDYFSLISDLKIKGYQHFDNIYMNGLTKNFLVFKPEKIYYNYNSFSCFYLFPEFLKSITYYNSISLK